MVQRSSIIQEDLQNIAAADLPWDSLRGANVLVSGASGFIGGYLVDSLLFLNESLNLGISVYAMARNPEKLARRFTHAQNRGDFVSVIQDIKFPWMSPVKIDLIIHAASEASPKVYLQVPVDTIKTNTLGTMHLLELAKQHQAKFLFLSSGAVYGDSSEQVFSETSFGMLDPLHSRACYSESKRLAETLCMAYWQQYQVHTLIARISHTYGPGLNLDDGRVFTDFIADVLSERDIVIRGSGEDSRPFCYITDMLRGLFSIVFKGDFGHAYNVGVDQELTIRELAHLMIKISGKNLKVIIKNEVRIDIRASGHFNLDKLKKLGWSSLLNPEQGFSRMYRHYLLNS